MSCALRAAMSSVAVHAGSWRRSGSFVSLPVATVGFPLAGAGFGFGFAPLRCLHGDANSPASPLPEDEQGPPQEAVLKAISEVSKSDGRVAQTMNVVIGGTVTDDATDEWLVLDQKVNSYPMTRGFTAIGTGGDDFVHAMVVAVESVLQQQIPKDQVTQKLSSGGKYVSVNIGPIQVISSEQVQAIYTAMKRDNRMKYFL